LDLVARLNREEGLTVVMVTHDVGSVARYAPRTVVMEDGRKVADRSTRELFADGEALDRWQLDAPQPVELSTQLARRAGLDDALPALTVEELVSGLGGDESPTHRGIAADHSTDGDRGGDS
jgi:energy-coupling factor transport system ATP-binding protein